MLQLFAKDERTQFHLIAVPTIHSDGFFFSYLSMT